MNVAKLPPEIRDSVRAVVWKREVRDGKPTKPPYNPRRPAEHAAVDNPATWGTFIEAMAAVAAGMADGPGTMLGDGIVGVDLDHCRDPHTGAITPEARQIVTALDSYSEVSPSGTGLHIIALGTLPAGRRRIGPIEMYSEGRYFTVTGEHLAGTPTVLHERTAALAAIHRRIFGAATNRDACRHLPAPACSISPGAGRISNGRTMPRALNDAVLLERAHAAQNGAKFAALWRGDASAYRSPSEADLALCNLLAFWTGGDAARIDGLFRRSGLWRPKWDERRGAQTYGEGTVATAIAGCGDFYGRGAVG